MNGTELASHSWEKWDSETQGRMAEELLFHGAARAGLVRLYANKNTDREEGTDDR